MANSAMTTLALASNWVASWGAAPTRPLLRSCVRPGRIPASPSSVKNPTNPATGQE
jgi:hypothetical protein